MKQTILALLMSAVVLSTGAQTPVITQSVPTVSETWKPGYFPISDAVIYTDAKDYKVVGITANMLADGGQTSLLKIRLYEEKYAHPFLQAKSSSD